MRAKKNKGNRPVFIWGAIALGGFAPSAFAYLDPSTGSMILSAIVGLFATAGLAMKTYWYKFRSFFSDGDKAQFNTARQTEESESLKGDAPRG